MRPVPGLKRALYGPVGALALQGAQQKRHMHATNGACQPIVERPVLRVQSHLFAFGCAGGRGSRTVPNAAVAPLPALLALCAPLGVFIPFLVEPDRADSEGPGPFCPRGVPAPSCSCPACSQPISRLHQISARQRTARSQPSAQLSSRGAADNAGQHVR